LFGSNVFAEQNDAEQSHATRLSVHSYPLNYYTEIYPPSSFYNDNQLTGISVELMRAMWRDMSMPQQQIMVVPWARGYRQISMHPNNVLFAMSRTAERDPLFKWVGPIFESQYFILEKRHSTISFRDATILQKQKRFCEEYVIDLNATQAAIRAGYSANTARTTASQYLAKRNIQDYVLELQQKLSENTQISAERVLKEYASLGFANAADFYEPNGEPKPINELTKEQAKSISKVIRKVVKTDNGTEITTFSYQFHDKLKALENVAKHIGFFEKDNDQKKMFPDGFQINIKK